MEELGGNGEERGDKIAKCSDTEESESDDEPAPLAANLLRQLRGAAKVEEVDRWGEVPRKSTVVTAKDKFHKQTKVTNLGRRSRALCQCESSTRTRTRRTRKTFLVNRRRSL